MGSSKFVLYASLFVIGIFSVSSVCVSSDVSEASDSVSGSITVYNTFIDVGEDIVFNFEFESAGALPNGFVLTLYDEDDPSDEVQFSIPIDDPNLTLNGDGSFSYVVADGSLLANGVVYNFTISTDDGSVVSQYRHFVKVSDTLICVFVDLGLSGDVHVEGDVYYDIWYKSWMGSATSINAFYRDLLGSLDMEVPEGMFLGLTDDPDSDSAKGGKFYANLGEVFVLYPVFTPPLEFVSAPSSVCITSPQVTYDESGIPYIGGVAV